MTTLAGFIRSLYEYANDFLVATMLFDSCMGELQGKKWAWEWSYLACETAILAASNFQEALKSISEYSGSSKILRSELDRNAVESAKSLLAGKFPGLRASRHRIAHVQKLTSQSYAPLESGGFIRQHRNLEGRMYTTTLDKRIVKLEVSGASLNVLIEASEIVAAAFAPFAEQPKTNPATPA